MKANIKNDFPIFKQKFNGRNLVYLDSAATSQKPKQVINAIVDYYEKYNANVSRSSHFLAEVSDKKYEDARVTVARFIGARPEELIFTKNATESLNLIAFSWGRANLSEGDVILTTIESHNSGILPWEVVAKEKGAKIKFLEVTEEGELVDGWEKLFTKDVKVLVTTHVSNVFGNILPVTEMCELAKKVGAISVVDGSQAVSKLIVNVKNIGCDFYAFSGHKMLGPLGIGVLWGSKQILKDMLPVSYGGGIVKDATIDVSDLKDVPYRFESGTPNIAGAVGLAVAVSYLDEIGTHNIRIHDFDLLSYGLENLNSIKGLKILGTLDPQKKSGLISFSIDKIHSHDIASVLSTEGICVRSGLHCAMNLFKNLNLPSATRASFHIYNDKSDVDALIEGLNKAIRLLSTK